MKKIPWLSLAWLFFGGAVLAAQTPAGTVEGIVVKAPLNVRAGDGMKYTVVAKLAMKNPVTVKAVRDEWLEIDAPENVRVWVLERYIKNNKLTTNVNLRSGPGTSYEAIGSGKRNTPVEVTGKPTSSGWVQIKALPGVSVFVGRPAIEIPEAKFKTLPRYRKSGRPLPDKDMNQLEANFASPGQSVKLEGYLYKSEDNIKAITHVLYREGKTELTPEAFIVHPRLKLKKFEEKKVRVFGTRYKIASWDMPVVVITRIAIIK